MKRNLPPRLRSFCLLLLFFIIAIPHSKATSLSAGDLAITSINMDSNDEFSFVLLTDISGTTTVYFTENGWNDVSNNWGNTSEGTIVWTYTGTANCGDEIQITSPKSSPTATIGTATEMGTFSLSGTGDGLNVYTGTGIPNDGSEVTNFIWSIFVGSTGYTSNASTTTTSGVPTGLTEGTNAVDFDNGTDNYQYDCSTLSPVAALRTALASTSVWTTGSSNENYQAPGCSYACSAASPLDATITTSTNPTCNGFSDGVVEVTATDGTSPYTYLWSTTATTAQISSLSSGTYTVTVTDNAGSTVTASTTLTDPTALVASATTNSNVSCNGLSDGQVTASETGGNSPFTYSWNTGATTATVSSLAAGTYSVTVTDASGCTDSASTTVTEPAALVASATTNSNVSCNGLSDGQVTASETGGTSPYTYSWNTGATTATVSSLAAGTYSVTVTDANGCTDSASTTVTEPAALVASATTNSNVSCNGLSDGQVTASETGGTSPYTYSWNTGATTATVSSLAAGTYSVTVTDANGCTDSASTTVTEPAALVASATTNSNVSCNGLSDGQVTASETGGTSPYTYSWNTGATTATVSSLAAGTYSVTVTDANGCTDSASTTVTEPAALVASATTNSNVSCNGLSDGQVTASETGGTSPYTYSWNTGATTATVSSLAAGTYSVTVTDANGCTDSASTTVTEPAALVASATTNSNVSCNGLSDGQVTASETGGTSPYTYSWNTGATTATVSSLAAGTYSVTVTDANGCTDSASTTVTEPAALVASATTNSNVSCNGLSDGQVTASETGGTSPYTYSWNTGATTATVSSLAAGTYSVTVTDANGCTDSASTTVTEPAALVASATTNSNVSCNGLSDGQVTASETGGTSPYTYSWNTGATTATVSSLAAGTYSVTVTDANGCTDSASTTVTEPAALVASATTNSNVSCNGLSDGQVTASETGGTSPYTYSWNTGATTATVSSLAAGTYSVTVTDANGCTDSASTTVTEPAALVASATTNSNVSCNGLSDGQVTASETGGTSPYTYSWNTGATTATVSSLAAGTYSVTVTDANGCTDSASTTVTEPAALVASATTNSNVSCNGLSDGQATASETGGTSPYTYSWNTGATTATVSSLAAGTYSVTVTDANGCTDSASTTVTESAALVASATTNSNVSCNGLSDGQVTASETGGTSPYTYSWNTGATTATVSSLAAGTYSVTVTDANGCTDSASTTVTEPAALVASATTNSNVSCNGLSDGQATASETGGTSPYTYSWNTGATTATVSSLAAGTYSVTVTDANGCTDSASTTVTEPAALVASATTNSNVSCNGLSDGQVTASETGGTSPYTYSWNTGATTATVSSLAAGTYSVTVTDANGCTDSASTTVTEPAALVASATTNSNVSCNGFSDGQVTASETGGTSPYTYSWNTGATTATVSSLAAGTYSVTVTDANGCTDSASTTVTEPAALVASATTNSNVSCNGFSDGQVSASETGGTSPYTYSWNTGATTATVSSLAAGTYSVTVTDANGCTDSASTTVTEPAAALVASAVTNSNVSCNGLSDGQVTASETGGTSPYTYSWNTGATTATVSSLAAGTYSVTVTDANGCTDSASTTVTEPAALVSASIVDSNVSCNGFSDGGATTSATGGTTPYTYNWSNSATTASITGVVAGTYSVTVTDANGCTDSSSVTITEPAALVAATVVDSNVSCNTFSDGGSTASATGGTMPYTYNWSNSATTASITGVVAGTYSVTVTDANGCTDSASVTITEPVTLVSASIVDSNVSCNGFADGGATSSATGGTMPYTYNWSNSATTASITGVVAGTYSVTVTDANGCTDSSSVTITEPAALVSASIVDSNVTCNTFSDGGATTSATGGTMPYTYNWSNSATTASITGVVAGTYSVTVTDANGCTDSSSVTITEPAALVASATTNSNVSCNGLSDGQVTASETGGTSPYTYSWNTGATTATVSSLAAGTYSVTVTDANGCTDSASTTVTEPAALVASATTNSNVSCNGFSDGQVSASETGGTSPYTYSWNTGATTATVSSLAAGTYSVTVTDANGCTDSASTTVTEPAAALVASATTNSNVSCNGLSDGQVTASETGGTSPYTYSWNTGATTATVSSLAAGTYSVTVTDANGCTDSASTTVTEPAALVSASIVDSNVSCNGFSDGGATTSATGGTTPYTYNWSNSATTASITGVVAGTYSVTVTDANGCTDSSSVTITEPAALVAATVVDSNVSCNTFSDGGSTASATGGTMPYTYNWSNSATTASITGVVAGTYSVTVTDANGCTDSASVTITEPVTLVSASIVDSNVSCNGFADGGATSSATGGTMPYTYNWSNSATTASITGVVAGTYSVTVTDANGCTDSSSVTITEPAALVSASIVDSNVTCNGFSDGGATTSATGGTGAYTYNWSNSATTASITGVVAGTYSVTVTDANGCTDSSSVTITEPAALVASATTNSNVSCNGLSDGQVTASETGGTSPYTYSWNTGATTATVSSLAAGTYSVTVTDANGCTDSASTTVTEPAALVASATTNSNVSCNGFSDGQVSGSETGGTSPYTYSWNTGATTATVSSLAAGTYSVTVTDANGCTDSASTTVTEPAAALVASAVTNSNVSCNGLSDGQVTASETGGTSPYTYSWNTGATTATVSSLAAGTYSVTVTDANGCTDSASTTVTEPAALVSASIVDSNVSCNGFSDGGATTSATGGTTPYTYNWSNSATTASITGVVAGTYSVTVTDANGCTDSSSVTITEPAALVAATVVDSNVSCNTFSDGGSTASATGGTMPYTYNWSNSATTASITGVVAGTYSVTVTDVNGCTDSASVTITEPVTLVSASIVDSNVSCNGFADGGATASSTGGTMPYTYNWSNSATTASITGVVAGTYSVTVTDANGCTDSSSVTITEPAALVSASIVDSNVTCNGFSDGGATTSATGGTGAYTYNWSNSATTASITGVLAGTYSVTVTDANGCTDSSSVTITEPTALVAATVVDSNVSCNTFSDGGSTASATGGTMPYTYNWSNSATTASITGVVAGTYSVTVTDANGCTDSSSVTVTEPAVLIAAGIVDSNVSCNGFSDGGSTASATGGTMPYTYNWSNSATTASITGVVAGTYSVTVTDANGCTDSSSVTITEPVTLVSASIVDSNVSCNGFADGGATSSATGGTMPYTYNWSNSATTASITGVVAGTYSVTVTDANGCTDSSSVTITEPAALVSASIVDSNVTCNGFSDGGATTSATGGTGAYTYNWSNSATTASITGVVAGTYSVTVTDANGCTDSSSVTITEPAALVAATVVDSNVSCNTFSDGGSTASATGGTMPYTYNWSNSATTASITGVVAGTYSVTVTDANGCTDSASVTITEPVTLVSSAIVDSNASCNGFSDGGSTASGTGGTMPYTYNWSNSATTASITGVVAGTYSVTVTDANGCTDSSSVTITEPTLLVSATVVDSNATCNGFSNGGATASATGGTGAYTYNWSNSATTASITGVVAGTYSVTVTDANGCTDSSSVTITEPAALVSASIVDSNVTCNGFSDGGATASATGGTGAYTYNWSNSATTASITGVVAGTYSVTVTDANGCTDSSSVTITEPASLVAATVADSNVSCNGFSDGGATASGTGGTMPYTYNWSNSATTASITGVVAGTYSVTVTDANGCTDSASVTITEPVTLVSASIVDSNVSCNGFADGGATSSATGGTMPYTYNWSNSATTASITGVVAGTYSVTVTDANGCTDSSSVTITEPAALVSASIVDSNVTCNGFSDGGATTSATGGTGAYTYNWSNSATTASITGVVAGTYSVTVTDANGCTDSSSVTITEPAALVAATVVDSNVNCNGFSDGGSTASATGGTMPYTYNWSNSATTASITGVLAGTYSVTVTDANGCTDSASVTITEPVTLVSSAIVDSNASCNGFSDGGATASGAGGTMPYTYNWSNSATTASITGVVAGTYSVTVTDANGCTDSSSVTITEPILLVSATVVDSNATCNGFSNGGATASATGGTGAYTYNWSNSATTASITGVVAGTYSVTVTDANGCTDSSSVTITEPAALVSASIVDSNVTCNGFSDGGATASATGGTGAYTYNWSNSATTASITGVVAGTYSVTVTDANGCTDSSSVTITEPAALVAATVVDSNVSCNGFSDGGSTASATGGTMPYTYNWSNSATTASITGVVAGTYSVTVTDANGCTDSASVTITEPVTLVSSAIVDSNANCNGFSDGGATASGTGGTMPYTYNWSNSATTASITGVVAGTYSVTVTDANGCTDSSSITITEPTLLVSATVVDSNATCNGFSNGGATASATGGTGAYTYNWSNSATTASITGVLAGTYSVTVTDANGCTDSSSVTITEPAALVSASIVDSNVSCNGFSDGGATTSATGGTVPYTYNWSNSATTASITGVVAGTYSVTVTDANGCTDSSSVTVTEPAVLIAAGIVDSNVSCNGFSDGGSTASATGGTMPYTYNWSNSATTASITGVVAGTYSVTVTDANGCTDSSSVTITEPVTLVSASIVDSNVSCNGFADGGATSSATGGTMPYTYNWSNSATTASITGVVAGTYSVTVTDANGCTDSSSVTITEPAALVSASIVDSNVTCNGFSDGGATTSATGGTGAYTYNWSNSATTASITGVVAGTYSVTVTDANGCTDSSSVTITEPAALVAATVVDSNVSCNTFSDGGSTASATGGTMPYTYNWSNSATTASITGVVAGTYSVTVTDANGCTDSASVTITEPVTLVSSAIVDSNASCNGFSDGGSTASGTGGTMPYTYNWSNSATTASITGVVAGTYSVTVTDANGCTDSSSVTITEPTLLVSATVVDSNATCNGFSNGGATASATGGTGAYTYSWSNSATTASITGVVAGTYSVTVTDANGCTDSSSVTITEPAALVSASIVDSNVTCNTFSDGGATTSATGGTMPYTYNWSNSATTASITGVVAGTYSVTVTDSNGCTDSSSVTVTEPAVLIAAGIVDSNVSCNGFSDGGSTASATGGTMPYTYNWSNSATTASITGVVAGTYSVTVTDANGCTDSASVTITEPVTLVSSAIVDSNASCNGFADGGATASSTGGTMPYTYNWSNSATTASITGVVAGTYSVTVTDANGCTDSSSVTITEPAALVSASIVDSNVTCNTFSDGGATTSATGGTMPYTYNWSNSATTASITGVVAGTYSVTVTDANGCTDSSSVTITEPAALVAATVVDSNVSCNGFSDGGSTASATGGTMPYTYNWSNSATTASITGVVAGTYSVTVTDANGCTDSASVTITEPVTLVSSAIVDSNASCNGFSDGGATASGTGGTMPYTYNWSNSATTASITGVVAGTYSVTVTDANGCTDSSSVTITEPAALVSASIVDSNVTCNGFSDGGATTSATGGTMPYTYNWSNSATTASITGVVAGTYSVTVTDANGCTDSSSITITEPAALVSASIVDSNVSCNGFSDGGATTSATGGTMPYTYNWSNSATTASITGVVAGTYSVTVTDANGCTDSSSVTITEPASLVAATVVDSNVSCNGFSDGGSTASATGGTMPYTYNWSNSATTASITGVVAGTYSVTVTDANGCTDSASVTITEPVTLVSSAIVDSNASCNGFSDGGATASGTGGTMPYTYNWSNSATTASITGVVAGTYSVTVTDANGCTDSSSVTITEPAALVSASIVDSNVTCNTFSDGGATTSATGGTMPYTYNWSNSATIASITGVVAGTYSVTVTDANGCTDSSSVTITEPAALVAATVVDSNVSCNTFSDGGSTASATGGTMPYTYNWSNSATTASITGVVAGTYSVTVTDANGCTDSASVTITEPVTLVSSAIVDSNASCNGFSDGGATASGTGGTMPYTYNWSNSATTASITGVLAGTYSVTVTDANGCTDSSSVTITEPTLLVSTAIVDSNASCNGFSNGGATASATGGTGAYTYNWSNSATTASITGVLAGTYSVTVTDANGCTDSSSVTITEPTLLVAATVIDSNASCNGFSDGGSTASATGGTGAYTYNWSNSATTASITGVVAGTYSVTVTDANGCTDSTSVTITEPAVLVAAGIVDSNVSCNGFSDGGATASGTGGTMPYTYNWNNSATTASITGVVAGTYSVTVTDANGCTDSASVTITEPVTLVSSAIVDSNVSCNGFSNGGATASSTGGTMPYTYNWSNSATTASITGVLAGTYSVTVTDANGCTDSSSVTITEPAALVSASVVDSNVSCNGFSDGGATASATGGTGAYTYIWSNSATTTFITGVVAGTYSVTVTDANGCTDSSSVTITEPSTMVASAVVDNDVSCNGFSDGAATASGTGGTTPYTYAWSTGSTNASITALAGGTYSVTVTDANGCTDSASVVINEPLVLVTTAVTDTDASCFGATDGQATASGTGGTTPYTYAWSNGGTTAVLSGITEGTYSVTITDANGCTDSASTVVGVGDTQAPVISGCSPNITSTNDPNSCSAVISWTVPTATDNCMVDSLVSNFNPGDAFPIGVTVVQYIAYDPSMNTDTCTFTVTVSDAQSPVITCPADISTCTQVVTYTTPTATDNCSVVSINRIAGLPSGSTFPFGVTTVSYEAVDPSGNRDTCSFTVTVFEDPTASNAGIDQVLCNTTTGLAANTPAVGSGTWTVATGTGTFVDASSPSTQVNGLSVGLNQFVWTITNGVCTASSDTVDITVDAQPSTANAGDDQILCSDFATNLAAVSPATGTGTWTLTTGTGTIADASDPNSAVSGLSLGDNVFTWTVTNGTCPPSTDNVTIRVSEIPVVDAGADVSVFGTESTMLQATSNQTVDFSWTPSFTLDNANIANPIATPDETTDYVVTGTNSDGCFATDSVLVTVVFELTIPTGITPNNDGFNDVWAIKNMHLYPTATVVVVDANGNEVFSSTGYNTPWDGTFNGDPLPFSSYFYVIQLNDGSGSVFTGTVTIIK